MRKCTTISATPYSSNEISFDTKMNLVVYNLRADGCRIASSIVSQGQGAAIILLGY